VHLHPCGNSYAANFAIYNTAGVPLESLSLLIIDRNTGAVLSGPTVSDTPFMSTDRTCETGGIASLATKHTLYIGNWLGRKNLQTHTLRAVIKLCTKNGLQGLCYTAPVEFVVP
jgi:hypothetical protein